MIHYSVIQKKSLIHELAIRSIPSLVGGHQVRDLTDLTIESLTRWSIVRLTCIESRSNKRATTGQREREREFKGDIQRKRTKISLNVLAALVHYKRALYKVLPVVILRTSLDLLSRSFALSALHNSLPLSLFLSSFANPLRDKQKWKLILDDSLHICLADWW